MSFKDDKMRSYYGSAAVFLVVIGLLVFLAFVEIPSGNNDTFKLIIGMIVGTLGAVIFTLIGKDPAEMEHLKKENEALTAQNIELGHRVDHLESMFMELQGQVINKLSVLSEKMMESREKGASA